MLRIIYNEYLTDKPYASCYWYVLLEEDPREHKDRVDCKLIIKIPCSGANYVLKDLDNIRISRNDYIIVDEPDKLPTFTRYARRVEKVTRKHKNEIFKIFNENLNRFTEEEKDIILNELLKD
jgi:hypothetical protein